jgi:hypothetical protein
MNVRKGAQRLYIVLTITWLTLCLYVEKPIPAWPSSKPVPHYTKIRFEDRILSLDAVNKLDPHSKAEFVRQWSGNPRNYEMGEFELYELTDKESDGPFVQFDKQINGYGVPSSDEYRDSILVLLGAKTPDFALWASVWRIWRGHVIAAFISPAFLYVLFFDGVPWIYRGFKRADERSPSAAA